MPLPMPVKLVGILQVDQRLQQQFDLEIDEAVDARGNLVAGWPGQLLVGKQHDTRLQRVLALDAAWPPARRSSAAFRRSRARYRHWRRPQKRSARVLELGGQRLLRGGPDGLAILAVGALVGREPETLQLADMVALNDDHA